MCLEGLLGSDLVDAGMSVGEVEVLMMAMYHRTERNNHQLDWTCSKDVLLERWMYSDDAPGKRLQGWHCYSRTGG